MVGIFSRSFSIFGFNLGLSFFTWTVATAALNHFILRGVCFLGMLEKVIVVV